MIMQKTQKADIVNAMKTNTVHVDRNELCSDKEWRL